MFIYNLINCLFGYYVLLVIRLDEYISNIRILDLTFCHLNFGAALILQSTDCLAILANNEAHCVVWDGNDVGRRRRCTVWSHHAVV